MNERRSQEGERHRSRADLDPRALVLEVMLARPRNEAEVHLRAAILVLLEKGLDADLVALEDCVGTTQALEPCREARLGRSRECRLRLSVPRHPLKEPGVGLVVRGDVERDEHPTTGENHRLEEDFAGGSKGGREDLCDEVASVLRSREIIVDMNLP